jgi:hypothetical protein
MRWLNYIILLIMVTLLNGCVLTKVVTVPMRVGGAVLSVVPVAGDVAHKGIDKAADVVDLAPI